MRLHGVVVILVVAGLVAGVGAAAGAPPTSRDERPSPLAFRPNDALTRAVASGRLTEAQYALQRAIALFDLRSVRARFGAVARPAPRSATLVLRDLVLRLGDLSPRERATAERLLARPTDRGRDPYGDGYTVAERKPPLCDANLCVHWVESTIDAPPPADGNGNDVSDWVETTLTVFQKVWQTEIDEYGYRRPRSDRSSRNNGGDGRLDVYLADVGHDGLYGYCTTDDPHARPRSTYRFHDFSAYCVVDEDFAAFQFPDDPSPRAALEVTAAHEFFHAVQAGYDWDEDLWILEGTAMWMEDEVFDEANGNLQFLARSALRRPGTPVDYGAGDFQYGAWLFWRFLAERFGTSTRADPSVIRQIWARADGSRIGPDDYSLQAVRRVAAARGVAFRPLFAFFAAVNRVAASWYEEGESYPPAVTTGTFRVGTARGVPWTPARLRHLTSRTYAFLPSGGVTESSRLRVAVDLPLRGTGPVARLLVYLESGDAELVPVPLNRRGDGSATVGFERGRVAGVELVVANASTRLRCWRRTPFSCQGKPLDDGRIYSFRASVL